MRKDWIKDEKDPVLIAHLENFWYLNLTKGSFLIMKARVKSFTQMLFEQATIYHDLKEEHYVPTINSAFLAYDILVIVWPLLTLLHTFWKQFDWLSYYMEHPEIFKKISKVFDGKNFESLTILSKDYRCFSNFWDTWKTRQRVILRALVLKKG